MLTVGDGHFRTGPGAGTLCYIKRGRRPVAMRQKVRSCKSDTKALLGDLVTWGERAASVEMELQLRAE